MSPNRTPRALSRGLECCSLTQKNRAGTAEVLESRPLAAATLHRTRRRSPARQSPGGRAGALKSRSRAAALTRASSRAPPLPPALAAGQLAARVLEERVREEMKWLLPPVAPGSAPAPGPGPGPGDLDPRRRRELFRVFTMVQPEDRVHAAPAAPGRGEEGRRAGRQSGPAEPRRAGSRCLSGTQATTSKRGAGASGSARRRGAGGGSEAAGRPHRPSSCSAVLSGSRAEPPCLPLSLSFSLSLSPSLSLARSLSLSSTVRQGSGAAGPTRPLPASAAAGRCKNAQPFPLRSLRRLRPPVTSAPGGGAREALWAVNSEGLGFTGLSRLGDGQRRLGCGTGSRVERSPDPSTPSQDRSP